jgi:hypothetical protein
LRCVKYFYCHQIPLLKTLILKVNKTKEKENFKSTLILHNQPQETPIPLCASDATSDVTPIFQVTFFSGGKPRGGKNKREREVFWAKKKYFFSFFLLRTAVNIHNINKCPTRKHTASVETEPERKSTCVLLYEIEGRRRRKKKS